MDQYSTMNFDAVRDAFTSRRSKMETIERFQNLIGRDATREDIAKIVSVMSSKNHMFFASHQTIEECQMAVAADMARNIKNQQSKNRNHELNFEEEFSEDDLERSDDDEPIQDRLRSEIYSTSETNASRTRRDLDWNSEKYNKPIDYNSLPMLDCRSFMGWQNGWDLVNAINPHALVRTFPILTLDTRNRILAGPNQTNRTTMQWNFYNGTRFAQGNVNGLGTIRDIVGIECGTFYFPNTADVSYTEFRQISMFIHEFGEQSSILTDKTRYHFLFNAESITGDSGTERLKLTPAFDTAETRFDRPITTLNTLTISFGCPAERITFGPDRDFSTTVSVANPGVFTTSTAHGLSNGDLVYFEGFTTDNPDTDATAIAFVNRDKGHIIQNASGSAFEVADIDTSGLTNPTVNTVIYGSRRFFIPLKFRYMGSKKQDDE